MGYIFESVDDALEFAEDRDVAIMPVDGGYLVTEWSDYYHRINEEAGSLYDGGWRGEGSETINQLIKEYQPDDNPVTRGWANSIASKLEDIEVHDAFADTV